MSKYRLGWPDLLLLVAYVPALSGHFDVAVAMLLLYAALYHRATRRRPTRFTRADIARIYGVPLELIADMPDRPER